MKNEGKIKRYLYNSFGWEVSFEEIPEIRKRLPYALLESAEYSRMTLDGIQAVVVYPRSGTDLRTTKQILRTAEKRLQIPTVLILDNIDTHQRRSLVENRINFIVSEKQIYLPSIGIYFNERGLGVKSIDNQGLSAIATAVIILQICKGSLQGKSVTEVASLMGYSIKTLSLAVKELEQQGLLSVKVEGRKKMLDFNLSSKDLWEKAYPLMKSPVEKKMFTFNLALAEEIGVKSSDSALAEVSMLATPNQDSYAIYARDPRLKELPLNPSDGAVVIEIWKTDPHKTSEEGIADIFSLALTYKGDDDPRIKRELTNLINRKL